MSAAWHETGRSSHETPTIHDLIAGVRAVPAFNFYTFSQLQGIVAAARQSQAPTLVQVSKRAWGLFETELLGWFVERYIPEWSEGYALAHLDHGWSLEVLQQALELGFQSVMFDGSHLSIRENIARTREAVVAARAKNALVEAEVGVVGRSGVPSTRTSVSEAVKLYEATEPDFLAVSIGNSHGNSEVSLDFGLAEEVRSHVGCPLAFHGGTMVSRENLERAVAVGFVKFNFATGVDTAEQDVYGELSASAKIPRSSDIQTTVAQRVKDFCLTKYDELRLCRLS